MFKWLLLLLLLATPAWAQNPTCPTRPVGDSSNACASTAFVNNFTDSFLPWSVPNGGTGGTSYTIGLPLIGNGTGAIAQGTRSGNTTTFATTTGTLTNGDCVSIGSGGNIQDAGGACTIGGGGGTVSSASKGQPAFYGASGTVVSGAGSVIYTAATTVAQAITDCGSASNCVLTANLTLGANGTFGGPKIIIPAGVTITQGGAFTLNIYGTLDAPVQQIFSGFSPGQISFGAAIPGQTAIRPEWWGAAPCGVTTFSTCSLTDTNAIQSAMDACFGGPPLRLGEGRFVVENTGTPGSQNGAALNVNSTSNPSNLPCDFGGAGRDATTIEIANTNSFNVLEIVYNNYPSISPAGLSLHDLTLDGNGANQGQQVAGDRYQNAFYAERVSGLQIHDVAFLHAAYHGAAFNEVSLLHLRDPWANDNYSSGFVFTGNVTTPWGSGAGQWNQVIGLTSSNNGTNGTNPLFTGDCSDIGVYIGSQQNSYFQIVTTGNNQPQTTNCVNSPGGGSGTTHPAGVNISQSQGNEIHLVSQNDSWGFTYDTGGNNNTILYNVRAPTVTCHAAINAGSDPGGNTVVAGVCN